MHMFWFQFFKYFSYEIWTSNSFPTSLRPCLIKKEMIYINQNMFDYQSLTYTASNFRTSEEIEIQASHQAHKEGKERYFLHRLLSKLSMCHMALRYRRAFSPTALSVCHCLLTAIFGSLSRVMNTEPFVQNIIRHSDVRS
jgi:hypothetical protein